jgi:hypothetical protein
MSFYHGATAPKRKLWHPAVKEKRALTPRLAAARFFILLYSAEKNKKRVDKRVRAYGGRREMGKGRSQQSSQATSQRRMRWISAISP